MHPSTKASFPGRLSNPPASPTRCCAPASAGTRASATRSSTATSNSAKPTASPGARTGTVMQPAWPRFGRRRKSFSQSSRRKSPRATIRLCRWPMTSSTNPASSPCPMPPALRWCAPSSPKSRPPATTASSTPRPISSATA